MPLIVISGRPCTGKTTFANALADYLRSLGVVKNVVVVNDESLGVHKQKGYATAGSEKMSRAALKAAVERSCNAETVVIADGLNYIKGFRYELYCIVRTAASTFCCVHVDAPHEQAQRWNRQRLSTAAAGGTSVSGSYSESMFEELWSRYETPDEKNRWDAPLFHLSEGDVHRLLEALGIEPSASGTAAAAAGAAVSSTASSTPSEGAAAAAAEASVQGSGMEGPLGSQVHTSSSTAAGAGGAAAPSPAAAAAAVPTHYTRQGVPVFAAAPLPVTATVAVKGGASAFSRPAAGAGAAAGTAFKPASSSSTFSSTGGSIKLGTISFTSSSSSSALPSSAATASSISSSGSTVTMRSLTGGARIKLSAGNAGSLLLPGKSSLTVGNSITLTGSSSSSSNVAGVSTSLSKVSLSTTSLQGGAPASSASSAPADAATEGEGAGEAGGEKKAGEEGPAHGEQELEVEEEGSCISSGADLSEGEEEDEDDADGNDGEGGMGEARLEEGVANPSSDPLSSTAKELTERQRLRKERKAAKAAAAAASTALPEHAAAITAVLPVFRHIAESVFNRTKVLRPPAAVVQTKTASANFLHALDLATSEVVSFLVKLQSSGGTAGAVAATASPATSEAEAAVDGTATAGAAASAAAEAGEGAAAAPAATGVAAGGAGAGAGAGFIFVPGTAVPLSVPLTKLTESELRKAKRLFDRNTAVSPVPETAIARRFVEFLNHSLKE